MKKYEYKFIKQEAKLGLLQHKNIEDSEKEWNRLGREGWKFCREDAIGRLIFIREVED